MVSFSQNPISWILTLKRNEAKGLNILIRESDHLHTSDLKIKIEKLSKKLVKTQHKEVSQITIQLLHTLSSACYNGSALRKKIDKIAVAYGIKLETRRKGVIHFTRNLLRVREGKRRSLYLIRRFDQYELDISDRLAFCKKMASKGSIYASMIADHIEKFGIDKAAFFDRLSLCKMIVSQGEEGASKLLRVFENLGFKEASVSDRMIFSREIVKLGGYASRYFAFDFNKFGLDDVDVSDRFSLSQEIAKHGGSYQLIESFDRFGLDDVDALDRLSLFEQVIQRYGTHGFIWNYERLGFLEFLKKCDSPESRLTLYKKIASLDEKVEKRLFQDFDRIGFIEDLTGCADFNSRFALFRQIVTLGERVEQRIGLSFEDYGFIDDIQSQHDIENRLQMCKKMIELHEIFRYIFVEKFESLRFVQDIQAEDNVEDRLILFSKISELGDWARVGFINHFEKFRFDEVTVADRLSLAQEIVTQGECEAATLVKNFQKFKLEGTHILDRLALCKKITNLGESAAYELSRNFGNLGIAGFNFADLLSLIKETAKQHELVAMECKSIFAVEELSDPKKRQIFLELLIPPSELQPKMNEESNQYQFPGTDELSFVADVAPITKLLFTIKDGKPPLDSDLEALEGTVKDTPLEPYYEKVKNEETEQVRTQLIQLIAYTAGILHDQPDDKIKAISDSGILKNIFGYHPPSRRLVLVRQLSYIKTEDIQSVADESGTKKWSTLTWLLFSRMKQLGFSEDSVASLLPLIDNIRGFKDSKRFDLLTQLMFQVMHYGPYKPAEMQLLEKGLIKVFTFSEGRTNGQIIKSVSDELQVLANIQEALGNKELFKGLESEKDLQSFFLEKFQEIFPVAMKEGLEFSDQYAKTFGCFRDKNALFTYARSVNKLKQEERTEVKKALDAYVNAVLNDQFPAIRYETDQNPHLEFLFTKVPDLKEKWLAAEKEQEIKAVEQKKTSDVDYREFFKQKILTDRHLSPEEFPVLCDFLQGKDVVMEALGEPKQQFQSLAIDLCTGRMTVEVFQKRVFELELVIGEFENDLRGLVPKKRFSRYTISESDDPCDLLLSGTEIQNSCQRVNGSPDLNKCLVSYLMNGEIRPIVVKADGKIVARSLLRLMWDEKNQTPVLLQERLYSNVQDESVNKAINSWAVEKAKKMGIPLVSREVGIGAPYVGTPEFKGGFAPFVYSDACASAKQGPFLIDMCHQLYTP